LERLSNLLPRFAQADPGSIEKSKRALLAWIGADKVTLEDATASFSDDLTSSINADELVTKLAENWKRFGCFTLYPATSNELYDGIVLALPIKPAPTAGRLWQVGASCEDPEDWSNEVVTTYCRGGQGFQRRLLHGKNQHQIEDRRAI
jgi:hypothetical protein